MSLVAVWNGRKPNIGLVKLEKAEMGYKEIPGCISGACEVKYEAYNARWTDRASSIKKKRKGVSRS